MNILKMFKKKEKVRRSFSEKILFTTVFIIFSLYAITLLIPTGWLIMSSLKDPVDFFLDKTFGKPFNLPKSLCWDNYKQAFELIQHNDVTFLGMFFNSVWITVACTGLGLVVGAGYAYALSRFKFFGSNILYGIIIFQMTIPLFGTGGANMQLAVDSGLYDTPLWIIFLSLGGGGMNFMIFYGAFKNLPKDYSEAVYIDGGGEFTIYFKIMLPFAMPIFVSLFVLNGMTCWNDYMTPMLYMPSWPTLASGMYLARDSLIQGGYDAIYFAATIISVLPMLIVYIAFNDLIMKNVSIGGLKG